MKADRLRKWLIGALALVTIVFMCTLVMLLRPFGKSPDIAPLLPAESPDPRFSPPPPSADRHPDLEAMYLPQDLTFTNMAGAKVSLPDLEGSVKVLYFFTSYCPYCKEALTSATAFARAVQETEGAVFYLVDRLDDQRETRRDGIAYYQEQNLPFPLLFDERRAMFDQLELDIVPTALFFDEQNRLVSYVVGNQLTPQVLKAHLGFAKEGGEAQTLLSVRSRLMGQDGSIASRYDMEPREVLCESQGLMMEYAVKAKDKALFDVAYHYIAAFSSDVGLLPWRITGQTPATLNATLDDLRIVNALLDAELAWGGYQSQADALAEALLRRCAPERQLRDFYAWDQNRAAQTLALCYVDVRTLARLSKRHTGWKTVYDNAVQLLLGGYISDDFPLYYPAYDYEAEAYTGTELNMAEAAFTLLQLARLDALPAATHAFLLESLKGPGLYARYHTDGNVMEEFTYESTAVYALLVLAAQELQDPELERLARGRMERMRILDVGTPFCGAYGLKTGDALYAFDQLTALLAWQAVFPQDPA